MNTAIETQRENIAETLARVLPTAEKLFEVTDPRSGLTATTWVALPQGHTLKEVDHEALGRGPRRAKLTAEFSDVKSFIDYVNYHASERSVVWAKFDPATRTLAFEAVLDEYPSDDTRWRGMRATYGPKTAHEWKVWTGADRKSMPQIDFAQFIEENSRDVHQGTQGMPSSIDMLKLATEFQASADKRVRSVTRLQSGGVRLEYVNDDDQQTVETMRAFERFEVAVPVFWSLPASGEKVAAYPITARLKYRQVQAAVNFTFELIRPDLVYQTAALQIIEQVRLGLAPTVQLLMGSAA